MTTKTVALGAAFCTCLLASAATQAGSFKDLHDFTASPDGREPTGSLVSLGGVLYGTTGNGGATDAGCIYSIDPGTGAVTVLHSFSGPDGSAPVGEMVAVGSVLYGTTSFGGASSAGTIFSFDPATATETVLYSFGAGTDGQIPAAGPVAIGATLYGTTSQGGAPTLGTAFSFDLGASKETVLHEFAGGNDGAAPFAPLTVALGKLFGTTFFGGPSGDGTVFSLDPATGAEAVLHVFTGGSFSGNPAAGLLYASGILYGTTSEGGKSHCGGDCGTVFKTDPVTGKTQTVYRFRNRADGYDPEGGLVIVGGLLYGTTSSGGAHKSGTLFVLDPTSGLKKTLHKFSFPRGANPGTLVAIDGSLFGTTHDGGAAGQGSVFEFTP